MIDLQYICDKYNIPNEMIQSNMTPLQRHISAVALWTFRKMRKNGFDKFTMPVVAFCALSNQGKPVFMKYNILLNELYVEYYYITDDDKITMEVKIP